MQENLSKHHGWLKKMYLYTLIGAGGFGIGLLLAPNLIKVVLLGWGVEDPIAIGIIASTFLAFALLSLLGLRAPLQFAPVLLLQLLYKVIWFIAVFTPMAINGELSLSAIAVAVIFATYIVGDVIALPFKSLFFNAD